MFTATKPFLQLRAIDLMSREVTKVPQTMSLRAAGRLLLDTHVTGAPVVNDRGECVGVLSATDFMQRVGYGKREEPWSVPSYVGCVHSAWQMLDEEELPTDAVEGYMTRDPVMVCPDTPITELAREMIDAHIHRVIIVDTYHQPIGVVSSTDILAAVAHADRH